ncbi:TIGR03089 family protein [Nocardioides perillae]|uniref:Uncharacterized protein (TIGR03089 family) n=1 Tax=Nocardioides perillae TaxID=1119534 RepID=A0A7Y9RRE7_9ACTN|nr:uncharacterized protein (TIGR03089 family) [Nocardioides perillae]
MTSPATPPSTTPATFAELLADLLRGDAGRPLVTAYDEASGERVELSVTTYANWVAKTASLLVEECDLERGRRLRIELPTHWLAPVFLGAAWSVGLVAELADATDGADATDAAVGAPDAVVCGPAGLERWRAEARRLPVVASALLPLGVRFPEPPGDGVRDFGAEVWAQPDAFVPWDPPTGDDEALPGTTQAELWRQASAGTLLGDGGRLLSDEPPASPRGLPCFTESLVKGGSLVLVAGADQARLDALAAQERATARAGQPPRS